LAAAAISSSDSSRPRFRFRVRGIGAHRQATLFVPLTDLHTLMMV
jgi:hypothetical protein